MIYCDIKSSMDIKKVINIIKREFRNLSQLTYPASYETTMGQSMILTIHRNLQVVMKVEGPKDLLDVFKDVLEDEKTKFYSKN